MQNCRSFGQPRGGASVANSMKATPRGYAMRRAGHFLAFAVFTVGAVVCLSTDSLPAGLLRFMFSVSRQPVAVLFGRA